MNTNIIVNQSIFILNSVFEYEKGNKKLSSLIKNEGYIKEIEPKKNHTFLKNYWYPEFRKFLFLPNNENDVSLYRKVIGEKLIVKIDKDVHINFNLNHIDIYIFPNEINLFSLDLSLDSNNLEDFSNFSNKIRQFSAKILTEEKEIDWIDFIEKKYLCGIEIHATDMNQKVNVDDYSGNKFKVYAVYDCDSSIIPNLNNILYDVGSNAKLGSASGDFEYSPSPNYLNEVLSNQISVFKNYQILVLFDSFTAIGTNLFDKNYPKESYDTWAKLYYRIYLHNLFLKYSLFMYVSTFDHNPVSTRDSFNNFINNYNINYLSFNFLPNEINKKVRKSLEIDEEIKYFESRINKISTSILEEQQNRSNFLLSIVSILASISSIQPIYEFLLKIQINFKINFFIFFSIISMLIIIGTISILIYLYPDDSKRVINRIKTLLKRK
jgi:hypothetical protein